MQLTLLTLDQKNTELKKLRRRASPAALRRLDEQLRVSWVLHDHALEGVVLTEEEMSRGAAGERGKDACQQLILDGISRHYDAIGTLRELANANEAVTLEFVKRMHVLCAPVDDPNAGRYRKSDGPLGAYMQSAPGPKAISYRLRKLVEFVETEAVFLHPIHAASRLHHQFMGVFPFDKLSGRAGRLLLGYWLMREGYPPVVIPAGMRADYFNALCEADASAMLWLVVQILEETLAYSKRALGRECSLHAAA